MNIIFLILIILIILYNLIKKELNKNNIKSNNIQPNNVKPNNLSKQVKIFDVNKNGTEITCTKIPLDNNVIIYTIYCCDYVN